MRGRPEVLDGVEMIVARALAKRPDDRFADVGEMQSALEGELLALTRDDGSETAEVPLVVTALEVADPSSTEDGPIVAGEPPPPAGRAPGRREAGASGRSGCSCSFWRQASAGAAYPARASAARARSSPPPRPGGRRPRRPARARRPAARPSAVSRPSSYDPQSDGGDGSEHPADAANVLDGDPPRTGVPTRTAARRISPAASPAWA